MAQRHQARLGELEAKFARAKSISQRAADRGREFDTLYESIEQLQRQLRELRAQLNTELDERIFSANYGPCLSVDDSVREADAALVRLRPTFVAVASRSSRTPDSRAAAPAAAAAEPRGNGSVAVAVAAGAVARGSVLVPRPPLVKLTGRPTSAIRKQRRNSRRTSEASTRK